MRIDDENFEKIEEFKWMEGQARTLLKQKVNDLNKKIKQKDADSRKAKDTETKGMQKDTGMGLTFFVIYCIEYSFF